MLIHLEIDLLVHRHDNDVGAEWARWHGVLGCQFDGARVVLVFIMGETKNFAALFAIEWQKIQLVTVGMGAVFPNIHIHGCRLYFQQSSFCGREWSWSWSWSGSNQLLLLW
jgi:hypothetical protein